MIKVDNALILAAGRGQRLGYLTENCPKPLLRPGGKNAIIEDIIINLKEAKIKKIFVVVGYLSNKFKYLEEEFNVKIINNINWDKGNNITSLLAAKQYLKNTLIVNGDIIFQENVLKKKYSKPLSYVEKNARINEWIVNVGEKNNIISFDKCGIDKIGYYQKEIIFINNKISKIIKKNTEKYDVNEYYEFFILDICKKFNIDFTIYETNKNAIFDLDTIENYKVYDEIQKTK